MTSQECSYDQKNGLTFQAEIEAFKTERQKQYDEFESRFAGTKDEIAAK